MDPEFKDWLQADAKDKYAAVCTICDAKLKKTATDLRLLTHKTSAKHLKCFYSKKSSLSIEQFVQKKKPEKDFQLTSLVSRIGSLCVFYWYDNLILTLW